MEEKISFPAKPEQLRGSPQYNDLRKRIDRLDKKVTKWVSHVDRRLDRLERKTGITKPGKPAKKKPAVPRPDPNSRIAISALRRSGGHSWKWQHL